MKMKRSYTKRKPKAPRKPNGREYAVASYLAQGDKPPAACRKAGYAESVVRNRAPKIARSEVVQAALAEICWRLPEGQLGQVAKARVMEGLVKLKVNRKEGKLSLGYSRTALEMEGLIGGPAELHLHQHNELPPVVQQMLLSKMREIEAEEKRQTIDAEVVETRPAEMPTPVEPPKPMEQQEEPIGLTLQEKQDRYVAWQASLVQNRSV